MRRFKLWCALGLLAFPAYASAEITVDAGLSAAQARVGEEVILTVVVQGALRGVSDPVLPQVPSISMASAGTSTNMSIVNGRVTQSKTFSYVLYPSREGKFVIPEIRVEHKGTTYSTRPMQLTVTPSNAPAPPVANEAVGNTTGNQDVFVRTSVDTDNPFVYEQVTLNLSIYSRLPFLSNPSVSLPDAEGFWKENLPVKDVRIVTLDGSRYQLLEVSLALFPTRSGRLEIGQSQIAVTVQSTDRRRDPFGFRRGRKVVLETEPFTLDVKALPPGAPEGFQGAVGDYILEVQADKVELEQNEPVVLSVTISGNGNLRTLGQVELPDLPEFRAYPEELEQSPSTSGTTVGGTARQKLVLVPLSSGEKRVPPLRLVTFSPRAGEYKVLQSQPLVFQVVPGSGSSGYAEGGGRSGIEIVGRDIRFIATEMPAFRQTGTAATRLWPLWFMIVPAGAYAGVVLLDRHRRRLGSDVAYRRKSGASRRARSRIKEASGEAAAAAAAAADAVRAYLSDIWNVPSAGLRNEDIEVRLREMSVDPEPYRRFFESCDAVRYAPSDGGSAVDFKSRALELVDRMENAE